MSAKFRAVVVVMVLLGFFRWMGGAESAETRYDCQQSGHTPPPRAKNGVLKRPDA